MRLLLRVINPGVIAVREARGVRLPTAPLKIILPPAVTVRLLAPSTVLPKVILPAVLLTDISLPRVRALEKLSELVALISPPRKVVPLALVVKLAALTVLLNCVVPVLLAVRLPRAAVLPTAPLKVMLPVPALRVKFSPPIVPSRVLLKVKLPLLLEKVRSPVICTASLNS